MNEEDKKLAIKILDNMWLYLDQLEKNLPDSVLNKHVSELTEDDFKLILEAVKK